MRTRSLIGSADKLSEPHVSMDHRVKPGGDEAFWLWQNSGADRVARTVFSFLPRAVKRSGVRVTARRAVEGACCREAGL